MNWVRLLLAIPLMAAGLSQSSRISDPCERGPLRTEGVVIRSRPDQTLVAVGECSLILEESIPAGRIVRFTGTSDGERVRNISIQELRYPAP